MIAVGGTYGQDLPLAGWLQDPAMTPVGLHMYMVGPQDGWLSGLAMIAGGMLVFRVP